LPVRGVIVALLIGGVVAMAVLAGAGQQWTLIYVMIALTGLLVGGPQICLNYLAVSLYPTAVRATGIGWAIGIGRVGTILGAAAGGPLLDQFGVRGFFSGDDGAAGAERVGRSNGKAGYPQHNGGELILADSLQNSGSGGVIDEGEVSRTCPVCQEPNQCGLLADASEPCWCVQVEVSDQALAAVPANMRGRACLCEGCLKR
jgi:hypothetical protein